MSCISRIKKTNHLNSHLSIRRFAVTDLLWSGQCNSHINQLNSKVSGRSIATIIIELNIKDVAQGTETKFPNAYGSLSILCPNYYAIFSD